MITPEKIEEYFKKHGMLHVEAMKSDDFITIFVKTRDSSFDLLMKEDEMIGSVKLYFKIHLIRRQMVNLVDFLEFLILMDRLISVSYNFEEFAIRLLEEEWIDGEPYYCLEFFSLGVVPFEKEYY